MRSADADLALCRARSQVRSPGVRIRSVSFSPNEFSPRPQGAETPMSPLSSDGEGMLSPLARSISPLRLGGNTPTDSPLRLRLGGGDEV